MSAELGSIKQRSVAQSRGLQSQGDVKPRRAGLHKAVQCRGGAEGRAAEPVAHAGQSQATQCRTVSVEPSTVPDRVWQRNAGRLA
ncbi:MAG: hypothetical protein K0U66_07495 [Gammaproteobacteria bacterium]|nr:hypothetical protein [Gammaproteobacteria bacterium]